MRNFKSMKGELSVEMIVLAALALIFLIVVVMIMTGKIGNFSKSLGDCENKGGICVSASECTQEGGTESSFNCEESTDVCCLNTCQGKGGTCKDENSDCQNKIYVASCPTGQICCG
ncbi:hypothetical protein COV16_03625 [Candidatus Woesearchaeota archaeon CG10_big_fil_rev_8_21_14_0_10_34_8]|nr:MAG: hypothetical protein COV16_03625 [Candidatus Woesearchaeota archaeon CG10_big_fil_rev_8_21_14_0_10_34_8]